MQTGRMPTQPVPTGPMRPRRGPISLVLPILLNAVLLAVLAFQHLTPSAQAQPGGQPSAPRPRGEYTLLSAKLNVGGPHAVYVLDSSNQELVALRWDAGKQSLLGLGYRNLAADSAAQGGR